MWQSRVEIEHYSVAYSIALPHSKAVAQNIVKGEAHTHCVNVSSIHDFTHRVSAAYNRSAHALTVQHYSTHVHTSHTHVSE